MTLYNSKDLWKRRSQKPSPMTPPTDKKLTAEEFYEKSGNFLKMNDKADKKVHYFNYWDMIEFADTYASSLQQEREPDGWIYEGIFYEDKSMVEGDRLAQPIPVYFSPAPVREVSDQEIQDAAFLKARIESERGKPVAAKYFALGAKHVRSLLSGERKEKG